MPNANTQKKNNKELIEIAAEQFARLFWKQWNLEQRLKKSKFKNRTYFKDSHNQDDVGKQMIRSTL